MSSCVDQLSPVASSTEQLCYIPCNFCTLILAVSVPCGSLFDIVTVRCGHCSNLWSVNMAATTFNSLTSASSISASQPPAQPDHFLYQAPNYSNMGDYRIENNHLFPSNFSQQRLVNPPPEKRQRVPSAYNQFIKEEIQRIKANNPEISHREAFSTAAKNWAHFPHIHFGLKLETSNQAKLAKGSEKRFMPRTALLND